MNTEDIAIEIPFNGRAPNVLLLEVIRLKMNLSKHGGEVQVDRQTDAIYMRVLKLGAKRVYEVCKTSLTGEVAVYTCPTNLPFVSENGPSIQTHIAGLKQWALQIESEGIAAL